MLKFFFLIALFGLSQFVGCARQKTTTSENVKTSTSRIQIAQVHYLAVQKVSDGDTATLKNLTDNTVVKVRFLCIDAPEKSQGEWGKQSLKKLSELLPIGSKVTLQGSNRDLYGRTVAEVINQKNVNINRKMVEVGLAIYYPFQKGCNDYRDLEKQAKSTKSGVWSDPNFEMPWDYRARNGIGARGRHNKDKSTSTLSPRSKMVSGDHHQSSRSYNRVQRTTLNPSLAPVTSIYVKNSATSSSSSSKASSRVTHSLHKKSTTKSSNPIVATSSASKQSTSKNKRK